MGPFWVHSRLSAVYLRCNSGPIQDHWQVPHWAHTRSLAAYLMHEAGPIQGYRQFPSGTPVKLPNALNEPSISPGTCRECHGFVNPHGLRPWAQEGAGAGRASATLGQPTPTALVWQGQGGFTPDQSKSFFFRSIPCTLGYRTVSYHIM